MLPLWQWHWGSNSVGLHKCAGNYVYEMEYLFGSTVLKLQSAVIDLSRSDPQGWFFKNSHLPFYLVWHHSLDLQFRSLGCNIGGIPPVIGRSCLEQAMLQRDICFCKGAGFTFPYMLSLFTVL